MKKSALKPIACKQKIDWTTGFSKQKKKKKGEGYVLQNVKKNILIVYGRANNGFSKVALCKDFFRKYNIC